MTETPLEVGAFYWVQIANDPDCEEWELQPMPARFEGFVDGEERWRYIGQDGVSDWPTRWVGEKLTSR